MSGGETQNERDPSTSKHSPSPTEDEEIEYSLRSGEGEEDVQESDEEMQGSKLQETVTEAVEQKKE